MTRNANEVERGKGKAVYNGRGIVRLGRT